MANISQKITKGARATQKLGQQLAQEIGPGTIVALSGDLGGGKTTFVQGLAQGLGLKNRILSPTFVTSRVFTLPKQGFSRLYHLDLYRLASKQIDRQALIEMIADQKGVIAIEWADKILDQLPKSRTWQIHFTYLDKNQRRIELTGFSSPLLTKS